MPISVKILSVLVQAVACLWFESTVLVDRQQICLGGVVIET